MIGQKCPQLGAFVFAGLSTTELCQEGCPRHLACPGLHEILPAMSPFQQPRVINLFQFIPMVVVLGGLMYPCFQSPL